MKLRVIAAMGAMLLICFSGCEKFVQGVEPPLDSIPDDELNTESQAPFLIAGVKGTFNKTYSQLSLLAGGLSDELKFSRNVPGASSMAYEQIDHGSIALDNEDAEYAIELLGRLRLYADGLVTRAGRIRFTDQNLMEAALYTGYLYGGIARYLWATYFGFTQTVGGGVIDAGPFIPSAEMYALAIGKLDEAIRHASSEQETRVVRTLIARIQLILNRYDDAAAAALNGLVENNAPLEAVFDPESANDWYSQAGPGRTQFIVDDRFRKYLEEEPSEAARIPLQAITGSDQTTVYYRQAKYITESAALPFLSWQENELILAEIDARDGRLSEALQHVNAVRACHGLTIRNETALDSIRVERDKELFGTGARLVDQRRFDDWHLPAGSWRYLPITLRERSGNPNLH
jgi:starch-binding outer membrane protein, SusD/RagB family